MRKRLIKWLGGYTANEMNDMKAKLASSINETKELRDEVSRLENEMEAREASHNEYVEYESRLHEFAHRRDGQGVSELIRVILCDIVQDEIGDSTHPIGGASKADVMEFDDVIRQFASRVGSDIARFAEGIKLRETVGSAWGCRVKCGVATMMSMAHMRSVLLKAFARIWAKEHKDTRQKDLLSKRQVSIWRGMTPAMRQAVNVAVRNGFTFWDLEDKVREIEEVDRYDWETQSEGGQYGSPAERDAAAVTVAW